MAMELRKAYRLSREQDEALKERAAAAGMSESEFIRLLITQQPKDYPDIRSKLSELISEVNRIGVNINEITYNNNSMLYSASDKSRLFAYMLRLNKMMDKAVNDIGDHKDSSHEGSKGN